MWRKVRPGEVQVAVSGGESRRAGLRRLGFCLNLWRRLLQHLCSCIVAVQWLPEPVCRIRSHNLLRLQEQVATAAASSQRSECLSRLCLVQKHLLAPSSICRFDPPSPRIQKQFWKWGNLFYIYIYPLQCSPKYRFILHFCLFTLQFKMKRKKSTKLYYNQIIKIITK